MARIASVPLLELECSDTIRFMQAQLNAPYNSYRTTHVSSMTLLSAVLCFTAVTLG